MGILAMHVDDFIFCGNDLFKKNMIAELKQIFKVGTHENGTFKFWRLGVRQTKDYYTPKSIFVIYIPKRHKERKVFEKKIMNKKRRHN